MYTLTSRFTTSHCEAGRVATSTTRAQHVRVLNYTITIMGNYLMHNMNIA